MSYTNPGFNYQPSPVDSPLENKASGIVKKHDSLDLETLNADAMQNPSHNALAIMNENGILSPAEPHTHPWDQHFSAGPSGSYHENGNLLMMPQAYMQQHSHSHSWTPEHGSGQGTPAPGVTHMSSIHEQQHFSAGHYPSHQPSGSHVGFSQAVAHGPWGGMPHDLVSFPQVASPISPQQPIDHMALAEHEHQARTGVPRRMMKLNTPPASSILSPKPGEGIRKKNNKVEIPPDRNIHNIDALIEKATAEEEVKELKGQKRLLRNREAALLSRTRKKELMESLDFKVKAHEQQKAMDDQHHQSLLTQLQQKSHENEVLEEENRSLKKKYEEEILSLRSKLLFLREQLEAGTAPSMSAAPSSTGFTELNAGVEALSFGQHEHYEQHEWDEFIYANQMADDSYDHFNFDESLDTAKPSQVIEKKASMATIVPATQHTTTDKLTDQPIAQGLIFMLLLCGAYIVSRPASSRPADMPTIPSAVQQVAPRVLTQLLDSDPTTSYDHLNLASLGHGPEQSHSEPTVLAPQNIDTMFQSVTAPTKQQQREQVFALTPAQYTSLTSTEYAMNGLGEGPVRSKRNLADALANVEFESPRVNQAAVYTRSLLWDQIPADVVKQWKDMVREHNQHDALQEGLHHDGVEFSKTES